MNVDITHLQKVEAGKVNVSMVTLVRLAEGLGVSLAELFDRNQGDRGRAQRRAST